MCGWCAGRTLIPLGWLSWLDLTLLMVIELDLSFLFFFFFDLIWLYWIGFGLCLMILCLVGRRNNDHAWYAGLVEFDIAGLVVWMSFFIAWVGSGGGSGGGWECVWHVGR